MRKILALIGLMVPALTSLAQSESDAREAFREKLLEIAKVNSPDTKIAAQEVNASQHAKQIEKMSWLQDIYGVGNINEFTINPTNDTQNRAQFFPRYNFGIRVSLGTIFLTPLKVRAANDEVVKRKLEAGKALLTLKENVYAGVEKLEEAYKKYRIKNWILQDYQDLAIQAKTKFNNGEIQLDKLQAASDAYYAKLQDQLTAQSDLNQIKFTLESLVNMKLESIPEYRHFLEAIDAANRPIH